MAWCLLYVTTFRAHLWVSLCFSLLLKAVKHHGSGRKGSHCSSVAIDMLHPGYPHGSCCCSLSKLHPMLVWLPAVLTKLRTAPFLLQVLLDPLPLFHVLWLSCSIITCHTQKHPWSGPSCSSKQSRWFQTHTFACPPWWSIHPLTAVKGLSWPKCLLGEQLDTLAPILN